MTAHLRDKGGKFALGNPRHELPILERYKVDPETECWLWLGNINTGYGRCKRPGTSGTMMAHRYFYEHYIGPIPAGLELDHLCRTRACVNPAHLEPVTRAENVRRGASSKLTESQVREIRVEMSRLTAKYGVLPRTLAIIAEGGTWKDVV